MKTKNIKRNIAVFLGILFSVKTVIGASFLPNSINNIMLFLFKVLPEGIRSGDDLAIVYFKLLLWIFVFAVMYTGAKKVFHDQNRVAVMLALVLSLTTVIMISNSFVKTIFELYAGLISVLLALLPLLVILYFNKKIFPEKNAWSGWAKGLVFIFAAMVVLFLSVSIVESTSVEIYLDLAGWMEIAAVVLLFMGLIMFFEGAGGMVKGKYPGAGEKLWDNIRNRPNSPEGKKERGLEKKENKINKEIIELQYYGIHNIEKTITYLENFADFLKKGIFTESEKKESQKALKRLYNRERHNIEIEEISKRLVVQEEKIEKMKKNSDETNEEGKKLRMMFEIIVNIKNLETNFMKSIEKCLGYIKKNNFANAFGEINYAREDKRKQLEDYNKLKNYMDSKEI
ncbi:MAG: hypothetical protein KAK00_08225 [Nanoarchaeota archaeon]|nr:hypothetical protein [Nanoarchaeota archaeon]